MLRFDVRGSHTRLAFEGRRREAGRVTGTVRQGRGAASFELLKVAGAGACHSDLHLMDWEPGLMPFDPPFTLGHENAGWVERVGAGVHGVEVG